MQSAIRASMLRHSGRRQDIKTIQNVPVSSSATRETSDMNRFVISKRAERRSGVLTVDLTYFQSGKPNVGAVNGWRDLDECDRDYVLLQDLTPNLCTKR